VLLDRLAGAECSALVFGPWTSAGNTWILLFGSVASVGGDGRAAARDTHVARDALICTRVN
jgi:hypothetical protein